MEGVNRPQTSSSTSRSYSHSSENGVQKATKMQDVTSRSTLGDLTNASSSRSGRSDQQQQGKPGQQAHSLKPSTRQVLPVPAIPAAVFSDPRGIDTNAISAIPVAASQRGGARTWIDVDAQNHDDPQSCSHYAQDVMQHLRETERTRRPNPHYLDSFQPEVNVRMRSILVDWLVEVAEEYRLCADTLYLTVNYLDRFLSIEKVPRSQLQLVGVTCMWIAAKYEEIYPPNVSDFSFITDNTYPKEDMVAMEETVLKALKYELTVPTAKAFLRRLLQVCSPDEQLHFLSNYLAELSLLDAGLMAHLPSTVAAASVFLALLILQRVPWDGTLQYYSQYTPSDIAPTVMALAALHAQFGPGATNNGGSASQLAALREKYGHQKFQHVARISPLPSLNPHRHWFNTEYTGAVL